MAKVHDYAPEVFEAVRTSLLVDSKEVRALVNNKELSSADDRRKLLVKYSRGHRRGRNVLLDLAHDIVRDRTLHKLPAGLAKGANFVTYEGDMADQAQNLADASVSLMVADIVYGDAKMAEKVAIIAARVLTAGGVLAMYTGHENTVDILNAAATHLELRATGWHRLPGSMRGAGTVVKRIEGLPIWIFCRRGARPAHMVQHLEFTCSNQKEIEGTTQKTFHRWEKDLDATLDLVRSSVPAGSVVLDPCCGSGTTGEAALRHGCRFIGIDVDREAIHITRSRLTAVEQELARGDSEKAQCKDGGGGS
jgi:hypothetical protein